MRSARLCTTVTRLCIVMLGTTACRVSSFVLHMPKALQFQGTKLPKHADQCVRYCGTSGTISTTVERTLSKNDLERIWRLSPTQPTPLLSEREVTPQSVNTSRWRVLRQKSLHMEDFEDLGSRHECIEDYDDTYVGPQRDMYPRYYSQGLDGDYDEAQDLGKEYYI